MVALLLALALVARAPAATAGPMLLFDPANGKVLFAEDQDQYWRPASLTKIMTAYVVFQALKAGRVTPETKLTVSEAAHAMPPSKLGLPVGGEILLDVGLKLLVVKSANDVAVMIAERVGGSEAAFVEEMNAAARRLGMSRTRFVNPHGLPAEGQVTTARDLARLATAVLRDHPEQAHLWSMPDVRFGKYRLRSHNSLLTSFEGADGIKTGFICDSGFNVVASATRDGRRLVAVVLGETSGGDRAIRAASLLEHGFQNYGWKEFFSQATLSSVPIETASLPAASIRSTIQSFECNGRRPRRARGVAAARQRARLRRLQKARAAKKAAAKAGPAAPAAKKPAALAPKKTADTAARPAKKSD